MARPRLLRKSEPTRRLVAWSARLTDALFPARCVGCGVDVDAQGRLCARCWRDVNFIDGPSCACCGYPFDVNLGVDVLCARCLASPPAFATARAAFRYDDGSRRLVLSYKHGDRLEATAALASWLMRAARPVLGEVDLVAPVPLHRWRLLKRRFNQAAELARALARQADLAYAGDLLVRIRATRTQGGLSRTGRQRNVQGAFQVSGCWSVGVRGRSVLLVDDVMTTGATVDSCARALLRAGAGAVHVVTLARVV
ncbi:MAG: ComF family protein [Alphaproteobacteria bacterium]|nr:MAG: ComF family protein [Alphaproteobacteria bacterium]